tara:strand:+ start:13648 stop:14136 length:489 start_codon:yes stop_codon:yes gene_type:complete
MGRRRDWFSNLFRGGGRGGGGNVGNLNLGATPPPSKVKPKDTPQAKSAQALENAPTTEVENLSKQANVKNAAATNKSDLVKLGLKGATGVAALMVLTGESNPVIAIREAVNAASKAARTAREAAGGGLNIINQLIDFFTNFGLYVCLCCCCIIFLIAIFMIM